MAAVSRDAWDQPRNSESQNTSIPGITEEYITEIFEEIDGRVIEKLSQEFRRTESRILGALSKLDEFLLNLQVRTLSGTVPGASRNDDTENREPPRDRSQNDPFPKAEFSACWSNNSVNSDTEETSRSVSI